MLIGMKKFLALTGVLVMLVSTVTSGCSKKAVNSVDLEQIDADSTNDYRYIFKEKIEEGKRREEREQTEWR